MKAEIVTFADLRKGDLFLWYPQGNVAKIVTFLSAEPAGDASLRIILKDGKMTRRTSEARICLVARLS